VKVRRDVCILPNGTEIDGYYYWEGGHFAQIFALTPEELVVLVRQYRHGVKEINVELPAGLIDSYDLNALKNAQQELLQETGFEAEIWTSLGVLHTSPSKSTTCSYHFLAQNAKRVQKPLLDETEAIEVFLHPIPEVLSMIAKGEIQDSNSIATCLLALQALGKI
jgi:ADP-ribose pyrophosphatase